MQTREKILKSKPSLRTSWVGAALANHMAGNYSKAFDLVTKSKDASTEAAGPYETSELLLFQNSCLEKEGKYDATLAHLKEIAPKVVDKLALRVKEAQMHLLAGHFEAAQRAWLALVVEQPDNYRFHAGLQTAHLQLDAARSAAMLALQRLDLPSTRLSLSDEQRTMLLGLYRSGAFKTCRKIEAGLVPRGSAEFREMLEEHMRKCLRGGVPALFHDICLQVTNPDPLDASVLVRVLDEVEFRAHPIATMALDIVTGYCASLRATGTFDGLPPAPGAPPAETETPSALLWSMFLQAHLLERCGDLRSALALIDECIDHTPTAADMYLKKAKILKKSGDLAQAAEVCDAGRSLDLQDRYLNNKATKYFLRADAIPQALATISLFTKFEGDPQQYLAEMQCSWFELEAGEAFSRTKQWGLALKKFYSVQAHFGDYVEDMFDFHSFCVRKTSLRAHADAVAMQDNVYAHKFFQRACRGALRIFLHLLAEPEDIEGLGHLSKEERKKEKAKRKKQKAKEVKAAEEKEKAAEEEAKWMGKASAPTPAKDADPTGEKYLAKNFLEEAQLWCAQLASRLSACEPETLALFVEVQILRGKSVQALRALSCGLRSAPAHPALTTSLVRFAQRIFGFSTSSGAGTNIAVKDSVKAVVSAELSELLKGQQLEAFVSSYVAAARAPGAPLAQRVSAVRCLAALRGAGMTAAQKEEAAALLDGDSLWEGPGVSAVSAAEALKVRKKIEHSRPMPPNFLASKNSEPLQFLTFFPPPFFSPSIKSTNTRSSAPSCSWRRRPTPSASASSQNSPSPSSTRPSSATQPCCRSARMRTKPTRHPRPRRSRG